MGKPRKLVSSYPKTDYWPWTRPIVISDSALRAFSAIMKQRLKQLESDHGKNAPPTKPT